MFLIYFLFAFVVSGEDIVERRQFACTGESLFCSPLTGDIQYCRPRSSPILAYSCGQGCSSCPVGICNKTGQSACGLVPSQEFFATCSSNGLYCDGDAVRYCTPSRLGWLVDWCGSLGCSSFPPRCNSGPISPSVSSAPSILPAPPTSRPNFFPIPPTPRPTPPATPTPFPSAGTCGPRIRNEWGASPTTEKSRFTSAVVRLHNNGGMTRLAQKHWDNQNSIHGDRVWAQFLVWHRAFVFEFEEMVRALGGEFSCFTVPYWNYDYSDRFSRSDPRSVFGSDASHLGVVDGLGGCIGGVFTNISINMPPPSQPHCIQRWPTSDLDSLRCSTFMDLSGFGETIYSRFGMRFQDAHGTPHVAVGGAPPREGVFSTHASPLDPLFFLHHANVDRVWALWQACRGNYELPGGQNQLLPSYGRPFSDFISTSSIRWQNAMYSVSYAPDQFGNRAVYSANFARLLSQCRPGTTAAFLASPILGVDQWAVPFSVSVAVAYQAPVIPVRAVQCENSSMTGRPRELSGVLAIYDSFSFEQCANQCQQFYFKRGGKRNCACTSYLMASPADPVSDNQLPAELAPACPQALPNHYALYTSPVVPSANVCFTSPMPQPVTPLTCSSPETSLSLSESWRRMNNLGGSNDLCDGFTPANVSLSVRCVR